MNHEHLRPISLPEGLSDVEVDLQDRSDENNTSRQKRLKKNLLIISSVAGIGLIVAALARNEVISVGPGEGLTSDQKVAIRIYEQTSQDKLVHNLRVSEEGANLRNRPNSNPLLEGDSGDVVGKLASGTVIEDAVVVLGGDPSFPQSRNSRDIWLAFKDPKNPNHIVFSSRKNFEPNLQILTVEPQEIK